MKIQAVIQGKTYEAEIDAGALVPTQQTFILEMQPVPEKPTLPTAQELQQQWDKTAARLNCNYFGPHQAGLTEYLRACWKSFFFATAIRKAEIAIGEVVSFAAFSESYRLYYAHSDYKSGIEITNVYASEAVGSQHFATQAGAELYKSAMGDDLKHLLSA